MNTKQFILDRLAEGKSRESIARSLGMTPAKINRTVGTTKRAVALIPREKLVIQLIKEGKTYVEIAAAVGLTTNRVVHIIRNIRKKGVATRSPVRPEKARELAAMARAQADASDDPSVKLDDLLPVPELCPVLGIPIGRPMMARFDQRGGFTRSNTVLVSEAAGVIMRNNTPEELAKVALGWIALLKSRSTPA